MGTSWRVLAAPGMAFLLAVGWAGEEMVTMVNGDERHNVIITDLTAGQVKFLNKDGSPGYVDRQNVAQISTCVPLGNLEMLDVRADAEAYMALGKKWTERPQPAARFHGEKLLWLVMYQDPKRYYEPCVMHLLDRAPDEVQRWALLQMALRSDPANEKFLEEARKLQTAGAVPRGAEEKVQAGRKNLAAAIRALLAQNFEVARVLLEAKDAQPDRKAYDLLYEIAKVRRGDLAVLFPKAPGPCQKCNGRGQVSCTRCPAPSVCGRCRGTGCVATPATRTCRLCGATGWTSSGVRRQPCPLCTQPCPSCGGRPPPVCAVCGGKGLVACPDCANKADAAKMAARPPIPPALAEKADKLVSFLNILEADPEGLGERAFVRGRYCFRPDIDYSRPNYREACWVPAGK